MPLHFKPPIHPGEILREEYLMPLSLSAGALARRIGVPRTRIKRVVAERAPITPDTALRLGSYFGTTAKFWLAMQTSFDLAVAEWAATQSVSEKAFLDHCQRLIRVAEAAMVMRVSATSVSCS